MKAITFLEYYFELETNICFPAFLQPLREIKRKARAYRELVSQPFAPEMLFSVFEGWEKCEQPHIDFAKHSTGARYGNSRDVAYSENEILYAYRLHKDINSWGRSFYTNVLIS